MFYFKEIKLQIKYLFFNLFNNFLWIIKILLFLSKQFQMIQTSIRSYKIKGYYFKKLLKGN